MQDQLLNEINDLKKVVEDQKDTIGKKEYAISELTKEKEAALFKKDEEIRELKRKIEEMSSEFARMLKVFFWVFNHIGNFGENAGED